MSSPDFRFLAEPVTGSALEALHDLFYTFLIKRDLPALRTRCQPELEGIGTGADEWYIGLDELAVRWKQDLAQLPPLHAVTLSQISEQRYSGVSLCQFVLEISANVDGGVFSFPPIRTSATFIETPAGWRLAHMHNSFAATEQAEGESLPRIEELKDANRRLERQVHERTAELDAERRKSERLLLNILPEQIAARLKEATTSIADHFDTVSVLFADIVGFTPLSQRLSPTELVGLLDDIFARFDALTDRYEVEKIKTIGDAYMAAAGIPTPCAQHAHRLADLALDMLDEIAKIPTGDADLALRIGIHSGPVVAGVIGQRKFSYDLWGDTVNVASRMESHGAPGRIQITEATHELISGVFSTEPRGVIEVKGKGPVNTWWLLAR